MYLEYKVIDNKYDYFYKMGNKYYILDNNGNYILTSVEDIYNYIDYRYLDISNIKEYIKLSTKDNNNYNIKVSDIILNSNNTNNITISIDESNNTITLDYTELFKIDNNNLNKEIVTIKYTNINKINSLEEWCHFKYILLKNAYNKVKDLTYVKKYVIM